MGYLGEDIKKLGFGLMRLPQRDGGSVSGSWFYLF